MALMAVATTLLANQVTIVGTPSGYGPYQTGSGGEFTFQPDAQMSWILNMGYVNGVTANLQNVFNQAGQQVFGTFQTFCVEEGEYIYPWATYDAAYSQASVYTGKPLTLGAAWLYHQFQIGQLQGYDYANRTTALALQQAIWWFMGFGPNPGNAFVGLGNVAGGLNANNGQIPVAVLNLWAAGHMGDRAYARQDMLICVPDGGLTLTLLGMGVGSLAMISRRIRK